MKFLYILAIPWLWLLYVLSGFIPRRSNTAVFGGIKDRFSDNSKYLYLDALAGSEDICWVTGSRVVYNELSRRGLPVVRRWTAEGIWKCLRAKTYVASCYVNDVNFWTSRGAEIVYLWHGFPLKKIERSVKSGLIARRFHGKLLQRLPFIVGAPHVYSKPDCLLVPAKGLIPVFAEAFGVDRDRIIVGGYPRNAEILRGRAEIDNNTKKTKIPAEVAENLFGSQEVSDDARLILYAPTWRDGAGGFLDTCPINWAHLDEWLDKFNARLTLRLHPAERANAFPEFARIHLDQKTDDIYPYLKHIDLLITDYSSLMYDFALLDRPIIIFAYDEQSYCEDIRGLYFDLRASVPGPVVRDWPALIHYLDPINWDAFGAYRADALARFGVDNSTICFTSIRRHLDE
jgi:CDP-glycerol glycerophosphotransferase (TagB/SpsB family)